MLPTNITSHFRRRSRSNSAALSLAASFSTGSSGTSISGSTTLGAATSGTDSYDDEVDSETPLSFDDSDIHVYDDEETNSLYTVCSQGSSNITASDLPGAGRTLGLLYSRWGRALESSVGKIAYKRGYGPDAVADQIMRATFTGTRALIKRDHDGVVVQTGSVQWHVTDGSEGKLRAACQKLVRYVESGSQHTRLRALERILQLITQQTRFRPYFQDPIIKGRLKVVSESTEIVSNTSSSEWSFELELYQTVTFLAKQTLLCIEDNPLNELAEELQQTPFYVEEERLTRFQRITTSLLKLLDFCQSPSKYSYIAKRYMWRRLDDISWYYVGRWNEHQFWSHFTNFLFESLTEITKVTSKIDDVEGIERLLLTLLLPRCRALHSLRRNPISEDLKTICRCSRNAKAVEQINPVLCLLKSPRAKEVFPRASNIAEEVWRPIPIPE